MQFGRALDWLLHHMVAANPCNGPIYLSKINLANDFYQISLQPTNVPKLSIVLPTHNNKGPAVAFPISLPMGWTNSPPILCMATKTIANITNTKVLQCTNATRHQVETISQTHPPIHQPLSPPLPSPPKSAAQHNCATQYPNLGLHNTNHWHTLTCLLMTSSAWPKAMPTSNDSSSKHYCTPSTMSFIPLTYITQPTRKNPFHSKNYKPEMQPGAPPKPGNY